MSELTPESLLEMFGPMAGDHAAAWRDQLAAAEKRLAAGEELGDAANSLLADFAIYALPLDFPEVVSDYHRLDDAISAWDEQAEPA